MLLPPLLYSKALCFSRAFDYAVHFRCYSAKKSARQRAVRIFLICSFLAFKKFLVGTAEIDITVGGYLDNSVRNGIYSLLVVRGEKYITLEILHSVVNGGYRFKVKMVGRLINDKHI